MAKPASRRASMRPASSRSSSTPTRRFATRGSWASRSASPRGCTRSACSTGTRSVNDEAGGVPYVVARCPLTDLSAVLDRRAAGPHAHLRELRRDLARHRSSCGIAETGTYWTPATGRALSGPLAGEALAVIPAAVTTAEAWRELVPVDAVPGDRRADGGVAPPPALCGLGPGRTLRREDRRTRDSLRRRRCSSSPDGDADARVRRRRSPREEERSCHARRRGA